MAIKKPVGLLFVITWCLLHGVLGTLGAINLLLKYGPPFDWPVLTYVFFVHGAVWLVLALSLIGRWSFARWVTIFWCGFDMARSSYHFFSNTPPEWVRLLEGGVYISVFAIEAAIIIYLLRPDSGKAFTSKSLKQC